MGDSPTPPTPESPSSVAATQQKYNTDAGIMSQAGSMVNQFDPFGSLTFQQTGTGPNGVPIYSANTQLNPQQQYLLDQLVGAKGIAGQQGKKLLSDANYGAQTPAEYIGNMWQGTTKDLLDKQVSFLNPYFTTQEQQLDTKLRNQGLNPSPTSNPNDPASWGPYERAINHMRQTQNQSVTGFLAQAQPQAFAQATQQYLLPAQLSQSLSAFGSPTGPTIRDTPDLNIQPANYQGAVSNYNDAMMKTYEAQKESQNNMMSGLFGIPTAVLGGWARNGGVQNLMGAAGSLGSLGGAAGGWGAGLTGAEIAMAAAGMAI